MILHRDLAATSTCRGQISTRAREMFDVDYWCVYCGAKFDREAAMRPDTEQEMRDKRARAEWEEKRRELALDILALVRRAEEKSTDLESACTSYDQISLVANVGISLGALAQKLETIARYNGAREREIESLR